MNINLREVICTSPDGNRFWRMPECYIKGSTIKYLRIPDEVIEQVLEQKQQRVLQRQEGTRGRGRGSSNLRSHQSWDRRGDRGNAPVHEKIV
ncbi:RNA processing protein [Coelomomyces lativittatus]|nr:RNA processing protein [Coelomomyces lativittatus]